MLSDVEDLTSDWATSPPAFVSLARIASMLASFFGVRLPRPRTDAPQDFTEIAKFAPVTDRDPHEGFAEAVVLDFAALKARASGRKG